MHVLSMESSTNTERRTMIDLCSTITKEKRLERFLKHLYTKVHDNKQNTSRYSLV